MSTNRWVNPVGNNLLRDAEGNLLPGGTLEIYTAGTSTPLAVYSDKDQTASLGSVLTADAYGLIADFHVTGGTQFKAIAKDSDGATKWTRDYLFSADSSTDTRLDAIETTLNESGATTYNAIVNGGMRVGLRANHTLTSSFAEGKVNQMFGRVTNVTAGTLTQGTSTAYESTKHLHFTGVSMSASGVVEAQIRIPSGEAARFVNGSGTFSCLAYHDAGTSLSYTVTIKKCNATDDFSALTTVQASGATTVGSGADTRLELSVSNLGLVDTGIAIEISAAIPSSITLREFRIAEAQIEPGLIRSGFAERSYEHALAYFRTVSDASLTVGAITAVTATVSGNAGVTGDVTVGGTSSVTGNASVGGTATIGTLSVTRNAGVTGTATAGTLSVTGNADVTGTATAGTLSVTGNAGVTGTATAGTLSVTGNGTVTGTLAGGTLQFNSGFGSVATAYGCRAWVNFDGNAAPATIRGSANVSSITDNGTGDYTVNFSNAMTDANYAVVASGSAYNYPTQSTIVQLNYLPGEQTTTASRVRTYEVGYGAADFLNVYLAVFR